MGFNKTNLFCSSIEDYWIGLSENIFESLRQLFLEHDLYVIFVQSPRYFESAVSLNEMGAAWVLKTDYCSILTKDMKREMMKGVVDDNTIFIKVDDTAAPARMNELKDTLSKLFVLTEIPQSTWERKRNAFLKSVNAIEYPSDNETLQTEGVEKKPEEDEDPLFDTEELLLFSNWANNPIDTNYMAIRVRGGLEVHFGYHNGKYYAYGQPIAEFEDFMDRLHNAGFIKQDNFDIKNNLPHYVITKRGYVFAKSLLNDN